MAMPQPVDLTGRLAHSSGLRGDYSRMRPDYSVEQEYSAYTEVHQDTWRRLYARQRELVPARACAAYLKALESLEALHYGDAIPRFGEVNAKLSAATRWELVPVPGLLPDEVFFGHLAQRRFPTTVWIREPHEFDYIVEPDLFHDFFGHVPMIFDATIADYLQAYGQGGLKASRLGGLKYLARLYWYTIEFGLIREAGEPRAYGAGILSSPAELRHAVDAPETHRIAFDLIRAMQTRYLIDDFQKTYFVIDSLDQLFQETAPDFSLLYRALERLPELEADTHLTTDQSAGH
jgi:phenylalanine-4-hydroxylase